MIEPYSESGSSLLCCGGKCFPDFTREQEHWLPRPEVGGVGRALFLNATLAPELVRGTILALARDGGRGIWGAIDRSAAPLNERHTSLLAT